MKKRLISLLLAFSMALTFLPVGAVSAFAAETGDTFNFNGLTYEITSDTTAADQYTSKAYASQQFNCEFFVGSFKYIQT